MSQTTYSVAALAAEVGVPRTTINDWLNRYSDYIDTITAGKRKVYSSESLAVLKTIASLRDSGKSGSEIELFLAQNHGIRPEVAAEEAAVETPEQTSDEPAANPCNLPATAAVNTEQNNLPALQNIERSAMELTQFIADLRDQQQQSVQRSRRVSILLLAVIVILLGAFSLVYMTVRREFLERRSEAVVMAKNLQKLNSELTAMEKSRAEERAAAEQKASKLQNELADLNARRAAMDEKMQQLNKQLVNMNDELKNAHKKASEQEKARLAEIAALQKEFADERSKWQQILTQQQQTMQLKDAQYKEDLQKKLAAEAEKSQDRLQELQKKLEAINNQLEKLNTPPVVPPTSPAVPATAPAVPPTSPAVPATAPAESAK